jgi:hypothetical protein
VTDADRQLRALLSDPALLAELRGFLWTAPYVSRGMQDRGWHCRDHAVVLRTLLGALGLQALVVHGKAMFVQGPTPEGGAPAGIGQLPGTPPRAHTWVEVPELGIVDLSPNLGARASGWRPVPGPGVIGSAWLAPGVATALGTTYHPQEYAYEIALATHTTGERRAIYLVEEYETELADLTTSGLSWCNSRMSLGLRSRGLPEDLYARFARHVAGVAAGSRRSLVRAARATTWSAIAADPALA